MASPRAWLALATLATGGAALSTGAPPVARRPALHARAASREGHTPLPVRIDGEWYDVGEWASRHPGGAWLLEYSRGKDVTALFHSIHLRSSSTSHAVLAKLPRIEPADGVAGIERPFVFERETALAGAPAAEDGVPPAPVLRPSAFTRDLQRLVDEEFPTVESTKATAAHWAQIGAAAALAGACWLGWAHGSVAAACALPLAQWLLAALTCHEATHSNLSTRPWLNYALQFTAHPLMFNVFCWIPEHLTSHHQFTNDERLDVDVHLFAPVRLSRPVGAEDGARAGAQPTAAKAEDASAFLGTRGYGQFVLKGCLSTLGTSLLQPLRALCGWQTPNFGENITPVPSSVSQAQLALSVAPSLVALLYPLVAFGASAPARALFLSAWPFVGMSIIWTVMTQVSHIQSECQVPPCAEPGAPGAADPSAQPLSASCWWARQAETALDYSVGSRVWTALSAGLNSQSLHHTLPMVCSCHYPRIYARYAELCARHGVRLSVVQDLGEAMRGLSAFVREMNRHDTHDGSDSAASSMSRPRRR